MRGQDDVIPSYAYYESATIAAKMHNPWAGNLSGKLIDLKRQTWFARTPA